MHLNSIVGAANAAGTSTALYSYGPYGEPGTTGGTGSLRFRYTGQQYIEELGLYYYKAQFYSPGLGRFLQTDPIGVADDLNLYAYVGGNPINRIDPRGLSSQEASLLNGTLADSGVQIACGGPCVGLGIPRPGAPPIIGGVPGNGGTGGYNPQTDTYQPYTPDLGTRLYNWMFNQEADSGVDKPAEGSKPTLESNPKHHPNSVSPELQR